MIIKDMYAVRSANKIISALSFMMDMQSEARLLYLGAVAINIPGRRRCWEDIYVEAAVDRSRELEFEYHFISEDCASLYTYTAIAIDIRLECKFIF